MLLYFITFFIVIFVLIVVISLFIHLFLLLYQLVTIFKIYSVLLYQGFGQSILTLRFIIYNLLW